MTHTLNKSDTQLVKPTNAKTGVGVDAWLSMSPREKAKAIKSFKAQKVAEFFDGKKKLKSITLVNPTNVTI